MKTEGGLMSDAMPASNYFDRSKSLADHILETKSKIRSQPGNAKLRVFLFQLLCIEGDWEKAISQLQIAAQIDAATHAMARAYREAIRCERLRESVFLGKTTPLILGKPPAWIGLAADALKHSANGEHEAAHVLREQAFEQAPESPGAINGEAFSWIADADIRLGPVCELFCNGVYYWVPFSSIKSIVFEKPQDLRDLAWQACEVTLVNEGSIPGFVPSRYPLQGTESDNEKMAGVTRWKEVFPGAFIGSGQRLWTTDANEHALLDVKRIELPNPVTLDSAKAPT
jgi:type VI secretion system protein ImpE